MHSVKNDSVKNAFGENDSVKNDSVKYAFGEM
jgi:hypothetical protein